MTAQSPVTTGSPATAGPPGTAGSAGTTGPPGTTGSLLDRVSCAPLAPYQSAVVRIGIAATWLFFLLRHWPERHALYGPDAPWSQELLNASRAAPGADGFCALLWSDSGLWLEIFYGVAVVSALAMLLGLRTRTATVLVALCMMSLHHRNEFVTNAGDRVFHLVALYLVFTRCAAVWSLDARRARKERPQGSWAARDPAGMVLWVLLGAALGHLAVQQLITLAWVLALGAVWVAHAVAWALRVLAPPQPRATADRMANVLHAGGLGALMAQVCVVYASAGWWKITGTTWQDGTAVHYPLGIDFLSPWPELSQALAGQQALVLLLTYGTVVVQVAFPFALLNRHAKNVLLVLMAAEHLGIAVLMGLPYFSLVMLSADAVFLPTVLLVRGSKMTSNRPEFVPQEQNSTGVPEAPEPDLVAPSTHN
ncbi:HTTM domain-containing protein [Streptomyces monticola]|uniref:HTTM domain-containing protein n=1 Tax=Streptomyces monticola TaxID=2666263 RepID=A0ABW2JBD2_9ACTN